MPTFRMQLADGRWLEASFETAEGMAQFLLTYEQAQSSEPAKVNAPPEQVPVTAPPGEAVAAAAHAERGRVKVALQQVLSLMKDPTHRAVYEKVWEAREGGLPLVDAYRSLGKDYTMAGALVTTLKPIARQLGVSEDFLLIRKVQGVGTGAPKWAYAPASYAKSDES